MKKGEKFERVKLNEIEFKILQKAEKQEKNLKILKRILAFKLLYKNWKYVEIATFVGITQDTFTNWLNIYKENGIKGLLILNYKGCQSKLSIEQLKELKKEAKEKGFSYAKEIKQYIKEHFKIDYHLNHVQKLSKKNFNYPLKKQKIFLEN